MSFALCGIIAIAGKRGSAPTMILSRAAFGVDGQKVPGVISWLVSIGWETFLAILAVLATSTIFTRLGWGGGTGTKVVAAVVVAALIVSASVAGYHIIMRMQSVLTWITGIVTVLYMVLTLDDIDWSAVQAIPAGSTQAVIGALVMVMTGFGLGWINIAADWSRYQKRTASGPSIVAWNTFGGALAPVRPGALRPRRWPAPRPRSSTASPATRSARWPRCCRPGSSSRSCSPRSSSLVSGAVLGIYSSGLTLLSLGVRLKRPQAAAVDGVLLTLGTIYVVFFADNFINPFQSFLITLGVPLAAWAGIMIADLALRRRDYDEDALFDASGRYGAFDCDVDRHDGRRLGRRLGPGRQHVLRRRVLEQLAGLPARPARASAAATARGRTPTSACCSPWSSASSAATSCDVVRSRARSLSRDSRHGPGNTGAATRCWGRT